MNKKNVKSDRPMANLSSNFSPSPQAWRGAAIGVFIATLLLIALSTIDLLHNNVSLGDAAIYFVAGSLITALIGAMLVFLFILFANISALTKWAIACFAIIVYYFFIPSEASSGIILIGIWTLASFSLTCGSIWSLIANRNNKEKNNLSTIYYFLLGLFSLAFLLFWFHAASPSFSPPPTMESKKKTQPIDLPNPSLPGPYPVKTLSYGHGTDSNRSEYGKKTAILTETVNGSSFISGWNGISGWMRTRYWGFGPSNLPLNGLVWYPDGEGPFPLILIVHGNHEMSAASDNGYAYLASLLASHGFIAVSIDENFLNGGWVDFVDNLNEVPARGWLLLEHLNLWRQWNLSDNSPFKDKIDMQKIALIGHSRGGEAIVTAAALNHLDYYPDNGNIQFNYHFSIQALAAIAPVDSQYHPGGQKTNLNNINYLVIQGAHDGDVRSFQGSAQYNRIHFNLEPAVQDNKVMQYLELKSLPMGADHSQKVKAAPIESDYGSKNYVNLLSSNAVSRFNDPRYHFKAALYIFGANHGQFNTIWGKNDMQPPTSLLFNLNQFLPENEQRQIAKVYITAFLKTVLHGEHGYLPLFHNWRTGRDWLPKTVYLNEFTDSKETFIASDEGSFDLSKTTLPGGIAKGEHLSIWRQNQIMLREGTALHVGTYLGWKNASPTKTPSYSITFPEKEPFINAKSVLVLSIADDSHHRDEEEIDVDSEYESAVPIDLTIELIDANREKTSLPLSQYAFLQPAFKLHLMRSDLLDPLKPSEVIFQTFEFPMEDFISKNPRFDPTALHEIRLLFNKTTTGLIVLDTISIRNQ